MLVYGALPCISSTKSMTRLSSICALCSSIYGGVELIRVFFSFSLALSSKKARTQRSRHKTRVLLMRVLNSRSCLRPQPQA